MKNKDNKFNKILGIIIVCLLIVIGLIFFKEKNITSSSFIKLTKTKFVKEIDYNYVITTYDDFMAEIGTDDLEKKDFDNYNYVLFSVTNASCGSSEPTLTNYKIDDEKIEVTAKYEASCGKCTPIYYYYLLRVDKSITYAKVNINYKAKKDPSCDDPGIEYKPMIYLYPEAETNVEVKLGYPELLTTTYPKYKDSWKVVAKPDGKLIDMDGREYYGLYWEGKTAKNKKFNDGFVVKGKDSISFLEEKLFILGLNEREANEFIIYWLPKLEKNKYNLIRFEETTTIDKEMPLEVTPKPDTVIRILMKYKPLNKKITIKEQQLETPTRAGFTIVEWGGTIVKNK